MNFIKKNIRFICVAFVILVVIIFLYPKMVEGFNTKPKVYGRDTCPWTIKQKKYFDDKGIKYDYVDCQNVLGCHDDRRGWIGEEKWTTILRIKKLPCLVFQMIKY